MKVGFVLTETVDGRFVPWESFLDWESYIDLYCLALMQRGHSCIKYVPSIDAEKTTVHRHKFGHIVKRIPVHHRLLNPSWISRRRRGKDGLTTTAHQLQGLGFTTRLLREAHADQIDVFHYSSYYSSFFIPAFAARTLAPVVVQYSGGALPTSAIGRLSWMLLLAPSFAASGAVLIGDYASELRSLRSQAGASPTKIRDFDSPVVNPAVFRPVPREEALAKSGFERDATNLLSVTFIPQRRPELLAKNPFLLVSLFARATERWRRVNGRREARGELNLYLAGFGPGTGELKEHARAEGVGSQVRLLGRVGHDFLPVLYSASDLVFVPYPFEKLNEGSVTFEAFACGKMVVGWRRSEDVPLEQRGGFLVDMDPVVGAEQLVSRLLDSAYMSRKNEECLRIGRQVSLGSAGKKLEACYGEFTRRGESGL